MNELPDENQLNKTLKVLTKATVHLIKAMKGNAQVFENQHKLYLDLIPILAKTNQALLKREGLDTAMVQFTDKINRMYGDAQNAQSGLENYIGAGIDILNAIKKLQELNKENSEELLKLLKEHNNIG